MGSGLRTTAATGVQFRVLPDQRSGVAAPGAFVERATARQDGDVGARVSFVGRDVPNRAVAMLGVVPG